MSKKTTQNTAVQANQSTTKKKALVVIIICIVTAIVIATSLVIALYEAPVKTPADLNNDSQSSSTATIKNGDFEYATDNQTNYPMTAQNWIKYAYKAPTSTTQGYQRIYTNNNTIMGIVDTANWDTVLSSLATYGVSGLDNPGKANTDDKGNNVYMIHNLGEYTSSIYSQSFSIPANTSIKLTVNLKTVGVTQGNAFVMVKQNSSSALESSTSNVQYWYAHSGVTDDKAELTGTADWKEVELHVFNRTSSSKTVYVNVGLGNVYTNEPANGTLFVDNVDYEEVTADAYRLFHNDSSNKSYVIDTEVKDNVTDTLQYSASGTAQNVTSTTTGDYVADEISKQEDKNYSPFVENDINLKSFSNDKTISTPLNLVTNSITINGPITGTHYHISLWIRVISNNNEKLAAANLYLYDDDDNKLATFATIQTDDDLKTSATNGWSQYHFYIKPSNTEAKVNIKVSLGDESGYVNTDAIPNATVMVTEPTVEQISNSEYSGATAGTYVSKTELLAGTGTASITNGSFSSIVTNSQTGTLYNPSSWTPVYAGSAELFNNGVNNITVDSSMGAVTSGIQLNSVNAPVLDDQAKGILQITNNKATSFGYLSSAISLNANTINVVSVLVRNDGGKPNLYLYEQTKDGKLMSISATATISNGLDGTEELALTPTDANWTRYFFVYVTGDTARTVRLALFNGTMTATAEAGTSTGTVYFDQALIQSIGSYKRDNTVDDLYEKDDDDKFIKDDNGDYILKDDLAKELTYTGTLYTDYDVEAFLTKLVTEEGNNAFDNLALVNESLSDITEPTEKEEDTDDDTTTDDSSTDVGLLISIISSAILIAALLIVVVVKFVFKKKQ